MTTDTFINLIENKTKIQELETAELKSIITQFPYFQTARALYLKGLKNKDSFKYNTELKITAAYTSDRTILFDYISANDFNLNTKEPIHKKIASKTSEEVLAAKTVQIFEASEIKASEKNSTIKEAKERLDIGKPLSFSSLENHSFNQWLQLSVKKPIDRKVSDKQSKKTHQIDTFIENNPKIAPLSKEKKIMVPVAKNTQDSSLMTETLAKVYLAQKKYENAIQAYRILSLKYPEKSGFFADQIKRIQILQKNKS